MTQTTIAHNLDTSDQTNDACIKFEYSKNSWTNLPTSITLLFLTGFPSHLFSFNKEWCPRKTWSSMLIESVAVMQWKHQYHGCQVCSWRLNSHLNNLFQFQSTLQNAVLFLQWDLLVTLIHHKNKAFQKLSPDWRNLKIPTLHFSVDEKQFNMVFSTGLIMWIGHHKEIQEIWELTFQALALHSDKGLTLETSASESLYGGQFTLSTQLIKPNYPVIVPLTQHHSFFRNLPPLDKKQFENRAFRNQCHHRNQVILLPEFCSNTK